MQRLSGKAPLPNGVSRLHPSPCHYTATLTYSPLTLYTRSSFAHEFRSSDQPVRTILGPLRHDGSSSVFSLAHHRLHWNYGTKHCTPPGCPPSPYLDARSLRLRGTYPNGISISIHQSSNHTADCASFAAEIRQHQYCSHCIQLHWPTPLQPAVAISDCSQSSH